MAKPLVIAIPHRLGKEEALRRLKNGLAEAGASFGHLFSVREQIWTGNHLQFQVSALGQAASGSIDVAEDTCVWKCSCLGFGEACRVPSAAYPQGRDFAA